MQVAGRLALRPPEASLPGAVATQLWCLAASGRPRLHIINSLSIVNNPSLSLLGVSLRLLIVACCTILCLKRR